MEWKAKFDAENNGRGGFSSVIFSDAGPSMKTTSSGAPAEDAVTGKQWFLQSMGDRTKASEGGAADEEALIAAGELEEIVLDEELLSKWASEAAFEEDEEDDNAEDGGDEDDDDDDAAVEVMEDDVN
jgi:hypothetical protein